MFKRIRFAVLSLTALSLLCGADWTHFRGNQQNSLAADAQLPLQWSETENIAWKVELKGRGPSSPIVVGDRVFVTCSSGFRQDRLHVQCFSANSGDLLWHRQMWANGRTMTHEASANAAPTPASDGKHVIAFYSSNDVSCYDLDGNLKWYRGLGHDYPKAGNDIGMASSPVIAANTAVFQVENQGDSFVEALDVSTGESRWRMKRVDQANWTSPSVTKTKDGNFLVLLKSSEGVTARDIVTGEEVWSFDAPAGGVPSLVVTKDRVYLPADGLTVLDTSSGEPELKWASSRVRPSHASPIIHDGKVYALAGDIVTCATVDDGEVLWKLRTKLKGDFWATPVLAGDHLYCINLDGDAVVIDIREKEGKIVGKSEFGEIIQGSPAVADDAMFVRSDKYLWKIASKN